MKNPSEPWVVGVNCLISIFHAISTRRILAVMGQFKGYAEEILDVASPAKIEGQSLIREWDVRLWYSQTSAGAGTPSDREQGRHDSAP